MERKPVIMKFFRERKSIFPESKMINLKDELSKDNLLKKKGTYNSKYLKRKRSMDTSESLILPKRKKRRKNNDDDDDDDDDDVTSIDNDSDISNYTIFNKERFISYNRYKSYNIIGKNKGEKDLLYNLLENDDNDCNISINYYYGSLKPGTYIGLKFLYIPEIYFEQNINYESIFGFDDYALLLYRKDTDKFTFLLPCQYTGSAMRKIYESNILANYRNVVILKVKGESEKEKEKAGVKEENFIWQQDLFVNHFEESIMIRIYNLYFKENNCNKVKKVIEKIKVDNSGRVVNANKHVSRTHLNPSSVHKYKRVGIVDNY